MRHTCVMSHCDVLRYEPVNCRSIVVARWTGAFEWLPHLKRNAYSKCRWLLQLLKFDVIRVLPASWPGHPPERRAKTASRRKMSRHDIPDVRDMPQNGNMHCHHDFSNAKVLQTFGETLVHALAKFRAHFTDFRKLMTTHFIHLFCRLCALCTNFTTNGQLWQFLLTLNNHVRQDQQTSNNMNTVVNLYYGHVDIHMNSQKSCW